MAKLIKTEKSVAEFTFEISSERFEEGMQHAYKQNAKKINVPGFRKGKATRGMIEKLYGESIFYDDAINFVCPDAYDAAVEELKIEAIDRPSVDIETFEKGKPIVIKATVAVKPVVTLGDYSSIKIEKPEYNVTDADVDAEINTVRERNARIVTVEGKKTIKKGDIAIIDFEGFIDGEAFPGGKGEDYSLEIGSNTFIPGFEEQLTGKKAGAEVDVNVTFPSEYHAEELAGKDAVFKVAIKEHKRKELPEADDEFAKDVSEFDTLDEYKADIKKRLTETAEKRETTETENRAIEAIVELSQMDVPQVLIDRQLEYIVSDFARLLREQNMELEHYLQLTGSSMEQFREQHNEDAIKRVKAQLTLDAIAEKEAFVISDEELHEEYNKLAEKYNMDVDKVKMFVNGDDLSMDLKNRRVVDMLVANIAK